MKRILILPAGLLTVCMFLGMAWAAAPPLVDSRDLDALTIYAYRDWQSTGVEMDKEQRLTVRAQGEWLYTPGEWHGAGGHQRYSAPSFYPVPGIRGGALIGKIGESGRPFYVGANYSGRAADTGMLYLRIDDDILSDNQGQLQVDVRAEN